MSVKNAVQSNFHNFFTEGCIEYIYEDEQCVAFDATKNQQAPTHFLVVPKKVIPRLSLASPEDEKILGHLLIVAKNIAKQKGLAGYHVVVDEDHRTVRFNGIHLFGRSLVHMMWPTGPGCRL
ncbi:histidine triad nucleotide-binding protein 2, mitochondrial-like [Ostrinia furnacalis]|uniref:histidine triad nucleotide-binding protein 2, mitochondrial-like n=1 Tax=Ostrinia furnacalis TaxID=93504 RepID=UPI001038E1DB|nr:histidine triad nucleotide-binding protein 2, mitochondrial-like [Ostrinia furnacalis]